MQIVPLDENAVAAAALLDGRASTYPWSEQRILAAVKDEKYFCWAIKKECQHVGFAVFSLVLDEATLLNISVEPSFQRQGCAQHLLIFALNSLKTRGAKKCFLEVRQSNFHASRLYEKNGFVVFGIRKNYYPSPQGREHANTMLKELI